MTNFNDSDKDKENASRRNDHNQESVNQDGIQDRIDQEKAKANQSKKAPSDASSETSNQQNDKTIIANQVPKNDRTQIRKKISHADKTLIAHKKELLEKKKLRDAQLRKKIAEDSTIIQKKPLKPRAGKPVQSSEDATRFKAPIKKRPSTSPNNKPDNPDKTQFKRPLKSNDAQQNTQIKNVNVNTSTDALNQPNDSIQILKERFVLEKVLGVGGMGVVYKAKDRLKVEAQDSDPYVAIKVLSEEFRSHPEAFISLQRESRKTQRIANPNTVKVYDFDRDGDVVFMTMEYLVGQPLDQLVKQYHATGLPKEESWNIILGMCTALIHAHEENIVHSDLKPGNVYVTDSGVAKIFDFGIARAVANIDRHTGENLDRTVFDAGNLGALTPAYASREMLMGQTPDTRDDIYALGCVAYEILTGDHPFNRLPADEAYNKKMKPKRITDIKKRQWKAIESALSFERKDRIASVREFRKELTYKKKSKSALFLTLLLLLGGGVWGYTQYYQKPESQISKTDIRNELEFEIRYNLFKKNIETLLENPSFSKEWEASVWSEISGISGIFNDEPDEWYLNTIDKIYQLYISQINQMMGESKFEIAQNLIENAFRYTDDPTLLEETQDKLAELIELDKERLEKEQLLAQEKAKQDNKKQVKTVAIKKNTELFNVALANVEKQLNCSSKLNMRDLKIAVSKLRSVDLPRYRKLEGRLSSELARCITDIGKSNPEHAQDAKRSALRIFKNNANIMAIVIRPRDDCNSSIAGLGARGERAACRDKIQGGGVGPTMVVIPANNRIKSFAIGRYEVTLAEIEEYCVKSKECDFKNKGDKSLPITRIDIETISNYLKWLSNKTKKKYRLPTKREWVYAAKSTSSNLDSNRNCQLSTRGIEKGGELVRATTGKQNPWGLVNYAGNAQELVYDTGKKLVAVGGSFNSSMDSCDASTLTNHSGKPDQYTGFRVARELENK